MKVNTNIQQILFLLLTLCSITVSAQYSIKGVVKDDLNQPLPGVNVLLEGTTKGTTTDFDGNYEITNVQEGTYTLLGSFMGYKSFSKQVVISGNTTENFTMAEDTSTLDEVIITGVTNPKTKIESSVSVTTLKPEKVTQSAPRSTAEIFRTIPGIRSESSGGEGNSNIAVRGVPISSGGSKYVQLQEDGLPVLLYGDIAFATADMFTRFDANVKNIEAIRGGSASTLSSNSPGGIINIISKTGKKAGGSVSAVFGLDYENFRTDVEYGNKINDNWYFHVGGFSRVGAGVRNVDYTGNKGGQLKLNVTRKLDKGYIRLYGKVLHDKAISYMPSPMKVTGTNSDPNWSDAPNFDATKGTLHTTNLLTNTTIDTDGSIRNQSVKDGMYVNSKAIGLDIEYKLGEFKLKNNGRYTFNDGNFISPFPESVKTASDMKTTLGATNLMYTNGEAVSDDALVTRIHMFDTKLNDFNNFMNDFRISRKFGKVSATLGFFKSIQNLNKTWLWNTYLQEVSDDNARLINAYNGTTSLTDNGLLAYGTPAWGNLHRHYDMKYDVNAPYLNLSVDISDAITIDGGVRYDLGNASGAFYGGTSIAYDVNQDGIISTPETAVHVVDNTDKTNVDYNYDYVSYTAGINYKFAEKQSVFVRYSHGASAKADRILFSGYDYTNGDQLGSKDFIDQAELGYKQKFSKGAVYATAFYAKTEEEGGFEATTNSIRKSDYQSMGLELEAFYQFTEAFDIRGAATYTKAKITSGDNDGNTPRRQPDLIYNLMPSYKFGGKLQHTFGLNVVGQTKAYAQDSNELVMPGFALFNGFITAGITKGLTANFSVNNIFDTIGITEAEEGSITNGAVNYVRARSLPGRSISLTFNYSF